MNRKENMEKIMEYLLDQITFQKTMVRDAHHKLDDAKEDNDNETLIKCHERILEKRENELNQLKEMLDFMQELHYEEESK